MDVQRPKSKRKQPFHNKKNEKKRIVFPELSTPVQSVRPFPLFPPFIFFGLRTQGMSLHVMLKDKDASVHHMIVERVETAGNKNVKRNKKAR
jgi:hypothetical protein